METSKATSLVLPKRNLDETRNAEIKKPNSYLKFSPIVKMELGKGLYFLREKNLKILFRNDDLGKILAKLLRNPLEDRGGFQLMKYTCNKRGGFFFCVKLK